MTADRGARATQRIADVLADTTARVRAATAPAEAAIRHRAVEATMEQWERHLADFTRPIMQEFLDHPDVPDDTKDLLRSITGTSHQTDFILNLLTAFVAIFSIAGAIQSGNIAKWQATGLAHVPEVRLTAAELAELVVRGVETQSDAAVMAKDVGLQEWRFNRLVAITGNPPGPQELLEAFRRGIIDRNRLEHGIRQSRTKDEWIDVIEALQYQPPGAAAAIEAAVQNHLPDGDARKKAAEAGLAPDNYDWMFALAGNPPGNEHMIDLMHRGAMTRAEVEQGMRESRIKNKYIGAMIDGGYHLPPMRTVISLGHKGLLTKEQVVTKLLQLGFHADDAAVMASEATADKLAASKDLARSQVVEGYTDRIYDRAAATGMLVGLGYDTQEAGFLLDLADHARQRRFTDSAVTRFHTLFVRRKIDRAACSNALDGLGVPPAQRDDLLKLWDLERNGDTPNLSAAQWGGLLRRGVIDLARHKAEVMKLGYDDEEATFLAALAFPAGQGPPGP